MKRDQLFDKGRKEGEGASSNELSDLPSERSSKRWSPGPSSLHSRRVIWNPVRSRPPSAKRKSWKGMDELRESGHEVEHV